MVKKKMCKNGYGKDGWIQETDKGGKHVRGILKEGNNQ